MQLYIDKECKIIITWLNLTKKQTEKADMYARISFSVLRVRTIYETDFLLLGYIYLWDKLLSR